MLPGRCNGGGAKLPDSFSNRGWVRFGTDSSSARDIDIDHDSDLEESDRPGRHRPKYDDYDVDDARQRFIHPCGRRSTHSMVGKPKQEALCSETSESSE